MQLYIFRRNFRRENDKKLSFGMFPQVEFGRAMLIHAIGTIGRYQEPTPGEGQWVRSYKFTYKSNNSASASDVYYRDPGETVDKVTVY